MFDGKAERSIGVVKEGEGETRFYRAVELLLGTTGLGRNQFSALASHRLKDENATITSLEMIIFLLTDLDY